MVVAPDLARLVTVGPADCWAWKSSDSILVVCGADERVPSREELASIVDSLRRDIARSADRLRPSMMARYAAASALDPTPSGSRALEYVGATFPSWDPEVITWRDGRGRAVVAGWFANLSLRASFASDDAGFAVAVAYSTDASFVSIVDSLASAVQDSPDR